MSDINIQNIQNPENIILNNDSIHVANIFINKDNLVGHQINSYNNFLDSDIQITTRNIPDIVIEPKIDGNYGNYENQDLQSKILKYSISFDSVEIAKPCVPDSGYTRSDNNLKTEDPDILIDASTSLPQMLEIFPHEARIRQLTYSSPLYLNLSVNIDSLDENSQWVNIINNKIFKENIGSLPVMLRSKICNLYSLSEKDLFKQKECIYDRGGYFIVNGSEKVILAQERPASNIMFCFNRKTEYSCEVKSQAQSSENITTFSVIVSNAKSLSNERRITASVPFLKSYRVPLVQLIFALGLTDCKKIHDLVVYASNDPVDVTENISKYLRSTLEVGTSFVNQEDALLDLAKSFRTDTTKAEKLEYSKYNLSKEILPHLGTDYSDSYKKIHYILLMTNNLIKLSLGLIEEDDKDSYINKRTELTGDLFNSLYKGILHQIRTVMVEKLSQSIEQNKGFDISRDIPRDILTKSFQYSLGTGSWGPHGALNNKVGVSQVLNRLTNIGTLSHLRRINTPLSREGKQTKPRQLHNTQWGYFCPAETPEGGSCGLIKSLALTCEYTLGLASPELVEDVIRPFLSYLKPFDSEYIEDSKEISLKKNTKVFIDGKWLGYVENTENTEKILRILKDYRRKSLFSKEVSISYSNLKNSIDIYTDAGRIYRPLFIVENNRLIMGKDSIKEPWERLLEKGLIEYLDVAEENTALIAMFPSTLSDSESVGKTFTHAELHPSVILGISTSMIPFPDHNQSPRNTYQASMAKQSVGVYSSNYQHRVDSVSNTLFYPQKPLAATNAMGISNFNKIPAGTNAIVAIAMYTGYNQEDSLIMSQSSIDRGFFRSTYSKVYTSEAESMSEHQRFERPSKDSIIGSMNGNYTKLDSDGLIVPGSIVGANDVIIGKTTESRDLTGKTDISVIAKVDMNVNIVEKVILTTSANSNPLVKVKISSVRKPQVGDKFACYTDEHDVLTSVGWVNVKDITLEHMVASLNEDTHVMEYVHPTEIQEYDYCGPMYNVESNQVSLTVTPNHRMYVSVNKKSGPLEYKMCEASSLLGKRRKYLKNCKDIIPLKYSGPNEKIEDGLFKIYDKDLLVFSIPLYPWLYLFGIWIAEGSAYYREDIHVYYVSIASNKERVREALDQVEIDSGGEIRFGSKLQSKPEDVENTCYRICDKYMAKYFKTLGELSASTKYLPAWVWSLDKDACRVLYQGLMLGDGCDTRYYTSSLQLADDVQRLIIHMGAGSNISLKGYAGDEHAPIKGKIITQRYDSWVVSLVTTQCNPLINKTVQQDRMIDFDGKVYCCTVPSGIICVRRNSVKEQNKISLFCGQSRSAQKGSIGMLYRQEDMPFTKDGIVPDIILNPHAMPSRMTIGHLIECLLSKTGAMMGRIGDSTPFTDYDTEVTAESLKKLGYEKFGNERLYHGHTGLPIDSMIFIGPTYYQRLKHMVDDKVYSRARGPIQKLVRQPMHGRAVEGGLRFGEMERDCLISHGASSFLRDRLFVNSDLFRVHVCGNCGLIINVDLATQTFKCNSCYSEDISQVFLPYAAKLLFQELQSMMIVPRIKLKDKKILNEDILDLNDIDSTGVVMPTEDKSQNNFGNNFEDFKEDSEESGESGESGESEESGESGDDYDNQEEIDHTDGSDENTEDSYSEEESVEESNTEEEESEESEDNNEWPEESEESDEYNDQ